MSLTTHPASPAEAIPAWEQFLEKHFKLLLVVCGVLVLALLGYGTVKYLSHQKALAAGAEFASAKTIEDCDIVAQKYPGTAAAGNALLLKADLLWDQNKKDTALSVLREFVSKHAKHPLYPYGLLAFASKLESLGERDEAKAVFERVINEFGTSDLAPLAQLRLGDLLWAQGKEDEAKKAYEALPSKFPNAENAFVTQSETRLNWIAAKLPTMEVDGPPKPKEAPPPPTVSPVKIPGLAPIPVPTPAAVLPKGGAVKPVTGAAATSEPVAVPATAKPSEPKSEPAKPASSAPAPAPAKTEPPPAPSATEPAKAATTPPASESPKAADTKPAPEIPKSPEVK